MQKIKRIVLGAVIVFAGCVGTDFIDDPLATVPSRIILSPPTSAVQVNQSIKFQATYYDTLGQPAGAVTFQWASSDPTIASVNLEGVAQGKQPGQTRISAAARGIISESALLTVVADPNQVAQVIVTPDSSFIKVGDSLQFSAMAKNLNGAILSGKTFSWRSSNPAIASIDNTGLVTAITKGRVTIIATTDGIDSMPAPVEVTDLSRRGTFTKRPGTSYNVSGTVTLEQRADGSLVLRFGDDFSSSNGPGLEVYLSNSNSVGVGSISLGRLKQTAGAQSYEVPATATLTTYNWVIIHCVPFNVTFGYAQVQ